MAEASQAGAAKGVVAVTREMVMSIVNNEVTRQLAKWASDLYEDQRKSTAMISSRVETVVDAFVTSCSPDQSDDVEFVDMPSHEAKMLDKLRKDRPQLFSMLSQHATGIIEGHALDRKAKVRAALRDIIAAAGGGGK